MKKFIFIFLLLILSPVLYGWHFEVLSSASSVSSVRSSKQSEDGKTAHYQLGQFISPETCGGCHGEIYAQWQGSMHNLASDDFIYNEVANAGLVGLTDKAEIEEAEHCQICHTPVGYVTGYPRKTSDERSKIAPIARQGVQCDYCHSITGAYAVYNAQFKYSPGNGEDDPGVKRGPFKDSESDYHKSEFSEFHTKSELCGTCHDVKHVTLGTWLETTYQEWQKSPYSKQGVQCQDCHMYQRPGYPSTGSTARVKNPGTASDGSVERDHIFTHYFVGGNVAIAANEMNMAKDNDIAKEQSKALIQMAEDRLKNSVDMKIDPKSEGDKVVFRITNSGAGHEVPTGLTNIRQIWLKVTVKDSKGSVIYTTGVPDEKGYLPQNTIIYRTVFGDGKGKPVDNLARAREVISDKRLKPMQEHVEKIDVGKFNGKITVEASLLYSGLSQQVADSLKGLKGLNVPVVVMKDIKAVVTR